MKIKLVMIIGILLALTAGSVYYLFFGPNATLNDPVTLEEMYNGDLSKVTSVRLMNGSTGGMKTLDNSKKVQDWISKIGKEKWYPFKNQDAEFGFSYAIMLYEGDEHTYTFSPGEMGGVHFARQEKVYEETNELFNSIP